MEIIGTIPLHDEPTVLRATRYSRAGASRVVPQDTQGETMLAVYVNDVLTMQLACSASHLVELVLGRLFTEGIIASADEVDALSVCEQSMRADVALRDGREPDLSRGARRIVATCCSNNITLNEYFAEYSGLSPVAPIEWDPSWVFSVADEFAQDNTSHARTWGSHSAYLADRGGLLFVREDIGRHNALDKVVGSALLDGVDLAQCLLFTSGRVPIDMTVKAIRAGVPILVSKGAATDKAVDLARSMGLTLICMASPETFCVMTETPSAS